MNKPRHAIEEFTFEMEERLSRNEHKGGWSDATNGYLLDRLQEEVAELQRALINGKSKKICSEAADVANFAMMLFDNNKEII